MAIFIRGDTDWKPPVLAILGPSDPAEIERNRRTVRQFGRNSDWLRSHWDAALRQACGKYVAVTGEEMFIADSVVEALERARQAHPEDEGAVVRYVSPLPRPSRPSTYVIVIDAGTGSVRTIAIYAPPRPDSQLEFVIDDRPE